MPRKQKKVAKSQATASEKARMKASQKAKASRDLPQCCTINVDGAIKWAKSSTLDRVRAFRESVTLPALKRMDVKPNAKTAVKTVPDGASTAFDAQSVKRWAEHLTTGKQHKSAVADLVALDATLAARG